MFLALNFGLRGTLANAEVLGPVAQQALNAGDEDVIEDTGAFFSVLGVIGCGVYLALDPLVRRSGVGEHAVFVLGMLVMGLGCVFLIDQVFAGSMAVFTVGAFLLWCVASPITQTYTIALLSKTMGSKPQAVVMGWLTVAGSLGRIAFALVSAAAGSSLVTFTLDAALCWGLAAAYAWLVMRGPARTPSAQAQV